MNGGRKAGGTVKSFRELNEMTQAQLAEHLAGETGERFSVTTVGRWEKDVRRVPEKVLAYMEGRQPGEATSPAPDDDTGAASAGDGRATSGAGAPPNEDAPPQRPGADEPPTAAIRPVAMSSQLYEKACIDLWDMIGFGLLVAGRGLGNPVIAQDGAIVQGMKEDLGRAYGKLAEQNDTFRRIIVGMTQGGVWVEVTGVTVQLGMAIAGNHAAYGQAMRQADADARAGEQQPEPARTGNGAAPHQEL